MMPRLTGPQVCEQLKQDVLLRHLPIIMLTGKSELQDKVYGINAAGEIVGLYIAAGGGESDKHGFFLDGSAFTTIDVPGAMTTAILDINARGDIVGYFRDGTGSHGFIGSRN